MGKKGLNNDCDGNGAYKGISQYVTKNETLLLFAGFVDGAPSSSLWKLSGSEWLLIK